MNSLLAAVLAVGVAGAMLTWYYSRVLHAEADEPAAHRAERHRDPVGAPPPLGAIPGPRPDTPPAGSAPPVSASGNGGPVPDAAIPLAILARWRSARAQRALIGPPAFRAPSHDAEWIRRLSGPVLIDLTSPDRTGVSGQRRPAVRGPRSAVGRQSSRSRLQALLRPTVMAGTLAQRLPQQRLLLAKGTFIDCTLETAIDSTLPGMTLCITSTDTFSADGTVVLLPRGTQLIGQTRGEVRQGMARVFVIWAQARTPSGVIVRLDSPATDSLGRSGLAGSVNRHFWERFGAALLVSTLTGLVQSQVQNSGGAVIVDPSASEDVLAQTLRGTEDIPPTIDVPNGQRIEVLVARDVDFRSVYALVSH